MYSYCMLPNIAKQSLLNNWSLDLQSFEIHIGGDHGQGAFRAPVKINFYYENEYSSYETWFFQVNCDKESYELLEKTFVTPLNTGIKMMIEKEVAGGESPDGHTFLVLILMDCLIVALLAVARKRKASRRYHSRYTFLETLLFILQFWEKMDAWDSIVTYVTCQDWTGRQKSMKSLVS